jgi:uncharacterized protein (DUF1697 family)
VTRVAVLLRGVNVGSRNRIAMPAFADAVARCGAGGVETYLQSGNAVAEWPGEPDDLAARVRERLEADLGLGVVVLVRTGSELETVTAGSPFGEPAEPKLLHVALLSAAPDPDRLALLDAGSFAPDEVRPGNRALYLRYAGGVQGSRLTLAALERRLGVSGTARNWTTVTALRDRTATPRD